MQAEVLALPSATGEAEYFEDSSVRRLVLDHYDREHLAVRRYLVFLGVDGETAQEIVQDAFLKLHEHLLAGRDRTNLRAWLYRVAHNLARNAQTAFGTAKNDPLSEMAAEMRSNAETAEEELIALERMERLRAGMQQLSPAQREALVLRAQGLKYREMAQVLNVSISTVAETVQRGLERLKELL